MRGSLNQSSKKTKNSRRSIALSKLPRLARHDNATVGSQSKEALTEYENKYGPHSQSAFETSRTIMMECRYATLVLSDRQKQKRSPHVLDGSPACTRCSGIKRGIKSGALYSEPWFELWATDCQMTIMDLSSVRRLWTSKAVGIATNGFRIHTHADGPSESVGIGYGH